MSIMRASEAETIIMSKNKTYKRNFKNRLKELIAEGDEEAKRAYEDQFPKVEWNIKEKEISQYKGRQTGRKTEKIPYIICKTCGKMTDQVQEFEDPILKNEKRKTWRRVIKPNLNYYLYMHNRKLRNRRLFFSYKIMDCLAKKHRLQLKFKDKQTIVNMGYDYQRKDV